MSITESVGKFNDSTTFIQKLDIITLTVLSYGLINYLDRYPKLTTFQQLIFTILVALIFCDIVERQQIGSIVLGIFCSIFWSVKIYYILPFGKLVNNELIWKIVITVAIFEIILEIHNVGILSSIKQLKKKNEDKISHKYAEEVQRQKNTAFSNELKHPKNYKSTDETLIDVLNNYIDGSPIYANGCQTYQANDELIISSISSKVYVKISIWHYGQSDRKNLQGFERNLYKISLYAAHNGSYIGNETYDYNNFNPQRDLTTAERLSAFQEKYHLYHCRIFSGDVAEAEARNYAMQEAASNPHSNDHSEQNNSGVNTQTKSIDYSLFNGCNDKESLGKRYRQLMKTFHPDNQNGDKEMTLRIQSAYDELMEKFN